MEVIFFQENIEAMNKKFHFTTPSIFIAIYHPLEYLKIELSKIKIIELWK